MTQIKGGDIVFWPENQAYMMRQHTRSQVFYPVPHAGNARLPVKLTDEQISTLEPIDTENVAVIRHDNFKSELILLVAKLKQLNLPAQVVQLPLTTMESLYRQIIFVDTDSGLKVAALNQNQSLNNVVEMSINRLNTSFDKTLTSLVPHNETDAAADVTSGMLENETVKSKSSLTLGR